MEVCWNQSQNLFPSCIIYHLKCGWSCNEFVWILLEISEIFGKFVWEFPNKSRGPAVGFCGETNEVLLKFWLWSYSMLGVVNSTGLNIPTLGVNRTRSHDFRFVQARATPVGVKMISRQLCTKIQCNGSRNCRPYLHTIEWRPTGVVLQSVCYKAAASVPDLISSPPHCIN